VSFVAISGSIIGLSCVPITQLPPSAVNLEFPLFLNGLASMPVQIAVQKGGLPHGVYSFLLNHPLLQYLKCLSSPLQMCDQRKGVGFMCSPCILLMPGNSVTHPCDSTLQRSDILAEAFCNFHGSKLHHTVLQLWRS
jgi:hypothetical protein